LLVFSIKRLTQPNLPVGENIFWSAWMMGRHPKYWDQPLEFRPVRSNALVTAPNTSTQERWLDPTCNGGKPVCSFLSVAAHLGSEGTERDRATLHPVPVWSAAMPWRSGQLAKTTNSDELVTDGLSGGEDACDYDSAEV
jgi:hypothetical protein